MLLLLPLYLYHCNKHVIVRRFDRSTPTQINATVDITEILPSRSANYIPRDII